MQTLQEQIDALKAENAKLLAKVTKKQTISFKVSPKGAVSVYGLGRFPATLYAGQWQALLSAQDSLKTFIQANAQALQDKR